MKIKNDTPRPRGRPRKFDRENALDRAVTTFWANGYNGTSVDALTENMGINRPSLYSTFGGKHDLFMEVIDRYAMTIGSRPAKALHGEPDIKLAVAAFLEENIRCVTSECEPGGCLIASVATLEAQTDAQVRDKLSGMFAEADSIIAERFRVAQDEGQIPHQLDPRSLARMIVSITHSFATRARVGASREELSTLASEFMTVLFPTSK